MSNNDPTLGEVRLRRIRPRNDLWQRRPVAAEPSDHFNGQQFFNPGEAMRPIGDVLTWLRTRKPSRWPSWVANPSFPRPVARLGDDVGQWRVTFINHATVLLQIGRYNLLTDPVWSERVSPFSYAGPKRVRAPGVKLADLPPIDAVLLSHNHYDHMDIASLRWLHERDRPLVVTGLGNASYLHRNGISHVVERDWWQHHELGELKLHFVPARHFSGRGLRDRDRTLWGGLVVESRAGAMFFAGDTGYGPHFRAIAERFPDLRLALLPIGAYEPRWFMRPVHMNPEDAVRAHRDLGARLSLAIHFNTFQLTDEPMTQPVADLQAALSAQQVEPAAFWVMAEGEGRDVPSL